MGEKREKTEYTTVSIPKALGNRVDEVVANKKFGYQNRPDFVIEAIRKRLRELGMLEETITYQALTPNETGVPIAELKAGKVIREVQVYVTPERLMCEIDGEEPCPHKEAAFNSIEAQKILREKGWKPKIAP